MKQDLLEVDEGLPYPTAGIQNRKLQAARLAPSETDRLSSSPIITGCSNSYSRDSRFEYQVVVGSFDARDVGECERFCVDSARCTGFGFMAPRGGGGGGGSFGRKNCEITDRNLREISRNMASTLVSTLGCVNIAAHFDS